jgi:hypothetical protein
MRRNIFSDTIKTQCKCSSLDDLSRKFSAGRGTLKLWCVSGYETLYERLCLLFEVQMEKHH